MKQFLENNNILELELIQEYMDSRGIKDPELLSEKDYELIEESYKEHKGFVNKMINSFTHMLKYRFQPSNQKRGWLITIRNGCSVIPELTTNEFNAYNGNNLEAIYQKALSNNDFRKETEIDIRQLPKSAKEAFGSSDLSYFGNWQNMRDNFIIPFARYDLRDDMTAEWQKLKW